MTPDLKLISMDEIKAEEVKWLWYPYLPRGKLTIVQGGPGEARHLRAGGDRCPDSG
mgnify:CR=1 FL=1